MPHITRNDADQTIRIYYSAKPLDSQMYTPERRAQDTIAVLDDSGD